ncbi:hypothetical protein DYD21_10330 [Rhodohalobacter sp. SW132]|uniref:hypothetical protein n=1 Tax=Rhodohalobacter sp. SW132 TaxID=2293433 RepID=UPI000E2314AC|nr:hypothetical protein [Rhodohalobacter sp. SW132]REL33793.1 hypothetical protein DYD21_10330 [Rhodohalobacter sp. SW132]
MRLFKIFSFSIIIFGMMMYKAQTQMHSSNTDYSDHVIQVTAQDYAFDAPNEIPSGWTTFEFVNEGEEPHLMWIVRLPEDKSIDDYAADYVGPLAEIWHVQRAGDIDRAEAVERFQAAVPGWWYEMQRAGGVGIVKPGHVLEVTLHLEPGSYILDCYTKTEDGKLHNMEGMVRELTVTEAPSETTPPEPDIEITLSNHEMTVEGNLAAGNRTVEVHTREFGHNVHVARIETDTEMQEIIDWMTPFNLEQFWPPAPTTFIGGIHQLPEGGKGYFTLDLEPGRYLFISQLTYDRDVWQEVTIDP